MALDINRKDIPIGSVVYFVDKYKYKVPGRTWGVSFGIVEEHYTSEICLQLIELKDTRLIDGVPILECPRVGPWHKLPKGWTYNTKLFKESNSEFLELPDIKDPQAILNAYQSGVLVNVQDNLHARVETDIDKHHGWRIAIRMPQWTPEPRSYVSLPFHEVYRTYDEAKEIIDAEYAEFNRQASLSDYDWSVEQIDRTLNHWAKMYGITPDVQEACRKRLLSFDNIEDLEVRLCAGNIEWKYARNRKWVTLQI